MRTKPDGQKIHEKLGVEIDHARVVSRLEAIDSFLHGIYLASLGLNDEVERDAMRNLLASAGDNVGDLLVEVRNSMTN